MNILLALYSCVTVPGPVASLMSVPMSNGSVRITWQRPLNSNGRILGYEVTYGPIGGVETVLSATTESAALNGLREL